MMTIEEMEKAREAKPAFHPPSFCDELKHELEHVNWRLVIAIAFGFLMWYAGTAMLDNFLHTCNRADNPACNEP